MWGFSIWVRHHIKMKLGERTISFTKILDSKKLLLIL